MLSDPQRLPQTPATSHYQKSGLLSARDLLSYFKSTKWWKMPTIYVPGAEMAASVDIDTDKLEERFNAQCIQ